MKLRAAEKEMLPNSVASIIRQAILTKTIQPGEKLVQAELAEQLGVSRMPVREALRKLEQEGLVIIEPHKGAMVAELTINDIDEIYEIRSFLEPIVLGRSIPNITEETVSKIKALHHKMVDTDVKEDYVELNKEFHSLLCSGCHSERLLGLMERVSYGLAKDTPYVIPGQIKKSNTEHKKILEAIEQNNVDAAKVLLSVHINRTREDLINILK